MGPRGKPYLTLGPHAYQSPAPASRLVHLDRRSRTTRAEDAIGQVVGFLVAGVIFLAGVGAILFVSNGQGRGDPAAPESAAKQVEASSLADLLLTSPGIGWASGADQVDRLGLQAMNGSGLDSDSIDKLRGAVYDANPSNGRVDYEEARDSLGIPDDTYFHLRMYPVGLDTVYQDTLVDTRVAYIGDWLSLLAVTVAAGTPDDMVAQANAQFNFTIGPNTANERQALIDLGVAYDNRVHIGATSPTVLMEAGLIDPSLYSVLGSVPLTGDVFPDVKLYLNAVLPDRLTTANYDVLFIGSGVEHASLTSDVTKSAIRDFVMDGGTLMVMGSSSQSTQWLEPLFSVGTKTVNGGPFAPDVSHPLLHEPNHLDWQSYDDYNLGWDIKTTGSNAHYADFTHVVMTSGKDTLTVSTDGAFGEGRIFLTEFRPRDIASSLGVTEAVKFMGNMFLYSEHDNLYLEYGPRVENGTEVSAVVRQSHVWDPKLGLVPVRLEVHLWKE